MGKTIQKIVVEKSISQIVHGDVAKFNHVHDYGCSCTETQNLVPEKEYTVSHLELNCPRPNLYLVEIPNTPFNPSAFTFYSH